jgi:hypothetical protein
MELDMDTQGNKKMKIKIQDFKVIAETGPLLKLAGFAATDDSVIPPPPFYVHKEGDNSIL